MDVEDAVRAASARERPRAPHGVETVRRAAQRFARRERGAVRDAEVLAVGTDEVVLTFTSEPDAVVASSVGEVVQWTTGPWHHVRFGGLEPDTEYDLWIDGVAPSPLVPGAVRTLRRPPGRRLATIATVNDLHVGELACGKLDIPGLRRVGPILVPDEDSEPYPELMGRAVAADLVTLGADAVVAKGDLTAHGQPEEYERFLACFADVDRMHHFRGNHDVGVDPDVVPGGNCIVELPGVTLAMIDTVRGDDSRGALDGAQIAWLDDVAASSTQPVLVFGHHHPWDPAGRRRSDTYFGIHPDDSEELCAVFARREAIAGYFAGHTHRNRVRRFAAARRIPIVEVAAAKDYPGAWAEYAVFEGGYTQVVRRASAPDAFAWCERTRRIYAGIYHDYALGELSDRCFSWAA